MTPAGIEPATFWFVAQHLNHCATAVPQCMYMDIYIILITSNHKNITVIMLSHAFFYFKPIFISDSQGQETKLSPISSHCSKWLRSIDLYGSFD